MNKYEANMDRRIMDWAIEEAKTKYADNVALILYHDSYRLGEDRTVYYPSHIVSDGGPLSGIARTVMVDGLGYDFFEQPWEAFERMAEGRGGYPTTLADSEIAYARSEEDLQRFLSLREKLKNHLADPVYMYGIALEWLDEAMELYKSMQFEEDFCKVREAGVYLADYLALAVSRVNGTYFPANSRVPELQAFPKKPEKFVEKYQALKQLTTTEDILRHTREMIAETRLWMEREDPREKAEAVPDYEWLAQWYQECSYYFRRIYRSCERGETDLAFWQVCWFQPDLDDVAGRFGIAELDAAAHFRADDLAASAAAVKRAEENILRALQKSETALSAFDSVDDFLRQNR